jgi:serine protease Do
MGVNLDELTPEIADGLGIKGQQGVLISRVIDGQPADQAGLKRNDVIVEYEGQPVSDVQKFRFKVADTQVGKKVSLVVLRDGKRLPFTVTLTERDPAAMAAFTPQQAGPTAEGLGGITVRDLNSDELADAQIKTGVIVTDVKDGSPGDQAGIQPNDIIEEVGTKPAANAVAFARLMKEGKTGTKKPVVLLVNRDGRTSFIPVHLSE